MKRIRIIFLSLLAAVFITACDNMHPEIDIQLRTDYTEILQAIEDANKSLSEKLALIEAASKTQVTDGQSILELIQKAIESLSGSLEEKIAAIQAAIQDQTPALGTKLALIEAAVSAGFVDAATQQDLFREALESMGGTLESKLALIQEAIKSHATSLETKLGLIEAAANSGFADIAKAQALIADALDATAKTVEEKLAAIESTVKSQTAPLAAKLALIETAVKEGFADSASQQELLQAAVKSLSGTMEQKLAAVADAVKSSSSSLEAKVDLIATALQNGIGNQTTAIGNMKTALGTSLGNLDSSLTGMRDQIIEQLTAISGKLTTEELAKVFKGIADAINSQTQTEEQKLTAIKTALETVADDMDHVIALSATLSSEYHTIKDAWAAGDVIFVFVEGLEAPKHLQMCYDGASWAIKQMDGDTESKDLLKLKNGNQLTLHAFYLPAASNVSVSASGTDFVFSDTMTWWYLSCTQDITIANGDLKGELEMQLPEGYVCFFVPDDSANGSTKTELREPHLIPQNIVSVAADGTVQHQDPVHGAPLKGLFRDGTQKGYCFGAILNKAVWNVDTSYSFTLVKGGWKGSYYYSGCTTTLFRNPAHRESFTLSSLSSWTPITDYKPIDVGCDLRGMEDGQEIKYRVYWSSRNLGATSDDPSSVEATYGIYYAWGEISPKETYTPENYKWQNSQERYTGTRAGNATGPGVDRLMPEDDAAHAVLGGIWFTPTMADWEVLSFDSWFKWMWNGNGYVVTSKMAGYDDPDGPSLFIPAAGYYGMYGLTDKGSALRYWSLLIGFSNENGSAFVGNYSSTSVTQEFKRYFGMSIRPVTH